MRASRKKYRGLTSANYRASGKDCESMGNELLAAIGIE